MNLVAKDGAAAVPSRSLKYFKKTETNPARVSFLLLLSHRTCGIFGMGFP